MSLLKLNAHHGNTVIESMISCTADPQNISRSLDSTSALALQLCFLLRYQQTRFHTQPVVAMERLCC